MADKNQNQNKTQDNKSKSTATSGITLDQLLEKLILKEGKMYTTTLGECLPYEYLPTAQQRHIRESTYQSLATRMRLIFPEFPKQYMGIQRQLGGNYVPMEDEVEDEVKPQVYREAFRNLKVTNETRATISASFALLIAIYRKQYQATFPKIRSLIESLNLLVSCDDNTHNLREENGALITQSFNLLEKGGLMEVLGTQSHCTRDVSSEKSERIKKFELVLDRYFTLFKELKYAYTKTRMETDSIMEGFSQRVEYNNVTNFLYWGMVADIVAVHEEMNPYVSQFCVLIEEVSSNPSWNRMKTVSREIKDLPYIKSNPKLFAKCYDYYLTEDQYAYTKLPECVKTEASFANGLISTHEELNKLCSTYERCMWLLNGQVQEESFIIRHHPLTPSNMFESFSKLEEEIVFTLYKGLQQCKYSSSSNLIQHLHKCNNLSEIPYKFRESLWYKIKRLSGNTNIINKYIQASSYIELDTQLDNIRLKLLHPDLYTFKMLVMDISDYFYDFDEQENGDNEDILISANVILQKAKKILEKKVFPRDE